MFGWCVGLGGCVGWQRVEQMSGEPPGLSGDECIFEVPGNAFINVYGQQAGWYEVGE